MTRSDREIFGLTVHSASHPEIRKLRRENPSHSAHGNKLWKASILLMDYLNEFPLAKRARVLEVGCGWGLAGIYCAKTCGAQLTSLDLDEAVFPFLQHHAALNGVKTRIWKRRYEALTVRDLSQFDVILGCDICFWDALSKPLYNLAVRASRAGVQRLIMTDPGRPPFREMAERCTEKFPAVYENWHTQTPLSATGLVLDLDLGA